MTDDTDIDDIDPTTRDPDALAFMNQGACNSTDPDLFFPGRGESTAEAKRICQGCPVRQECLDYAMTPPFERFGIWGGLSERERRRIRRQSLHTREDGAA
jgi:WhiB family redox-sensing transcriptional regulator